MAEDSAEPNDLRSTDGRLPSSIDPAISRSTSAGATEQHPQDVTAKSGTEPMEIDASQIPDGGPHTPSGPDLTHRPSSVVHATLLDVTEDETLVPAGKNMTAQEDTQMPDISADMADRLLQAIQADGATAGDKDNTTATAPNTSARVEAESSQNNDITTKATMQDGVNDSTGGHVEGAERLDGDGIIDLDEDFDAEAYILRGPNNNGGQRADGIETVTLDDADAWMKDFNVEEDEDADEEAHQRYASVLAQALEWSY